MEASPIVFVRVKKHGFKLRLVLKASAIFSAVSLLGCTPSQVITSTTPNTSNTDNDVFTKTNNESGGGVYSLPKTLLEISGAWQSDSSSIQYTLTPTTVGDASARYQLHYKRAYFTDDVFAYKIDSNGLLSGDANSTATSEHGAVIADIAQAVVEVAKGGVLPRLIKTTKPAATTCTPIAPAGLPFTTYIDLADLAKADTAGLQLPDGGSIAIKGSDSVTRLQTVTPPPSLPNQSFYYRVPMAVTFTVKAPVATCSDGTKGMLPVSVDKLVPGIVDPSSTASVNLIRLPFITRTDSYTFSEGMLTASSVNSPSQALGAAKIPLDVLSAIGKSVSSIIPTLSSSTTTNNNSSVAPATPTK